MWYNTKRSLRCKVVSNKAENCSAKNSSESSSQPARTLRKKPIGLFAESQPALYISIEPTTSMNSQASTSRHVSFDENNNERSKRQLSISSVENIQNNRKTAKNSSFGEQSSSLEDFTVEQLIEFSKTNSYPKKEFLISNTIRKFTVILHFFDSTRIFSNKPEDKLEFTCKICTKSYLAKLGETTNLNKHLNKHSELNEWMKSYDVFNNGSKKAKITDEDFKIIEFIISSNTSLSQLKNPKFHNLIGSNVPCYEKFRDNFLPSVMDKLREAITKKLNNANTVCLLVDLWSSKNGSDFIALIGLLGSKAFEREIVVLDMVKMNDSHTSENIKLAIENIINGYEFENSKITCKWHFYNYLSEIVFFNEL